MAASCDPNPPQELADLMHRGWVAFLHDHRAPWPTWSGEGRAMVFDAEPGLRPAYALERRMAEALD